MRKKTGHEFFEVFRRLPEAEKARRWWNKKPKSASSSASVEAPRNLARDTTTPPGRLKLTFTREALAVLVPVLAIALVASHVWGYKRGFKNGNAAVAQNQNAQRGQTVARNNAPQPQQQQPPAEDVRTLTVKNEAPKVTVPFVTLQVATLPNRSNAKELATYLTNHQYPAFVRSAGNQFTVNVGQYQDLRAASRSGVKEQVARLSYGERKGFFVSSYYVTVNDLGSIVK